MRRSTAAAAALALALPAPAFAYQLEHDDSGANVHWKQGFTLYVDAHSRDLKHDEVIAAVQRAAAKWAAQASVQIDVQNEGSHGKSGYDGSGNDKSEVIFVDDEWEGDDSVVATTLVTTDDSTHEILDADILVNEVDNHFAILPDDSQPGQGLETDFEATITHELGHALGLAHNNDLPEATMYPSTQPGEISKRVLAQDDIQGVQQLYGAPGAAPAGETPNVGCTSGLGSDGVLALFAVLLMAAARRVRRPAFALAAGLCALAPSLAHADPVVEQRVEGEVLATRSYWMNGRIYTDVDVSVGACQKAPCASQVTFRQPGGKVGQISQQLGDLKVPPPGAHVTVSLARARDGALRLVPLRAAK